MKRFDMSQKEDIIQYYMALSLNSMFGIQNLPQIFNHKNTPYYEYCLETIRKCFLQLKDFPKVTSKKIYNMLFKITQPEIEKMYLNYNWNIIWKKVTFKYMNVYDRHFVFKYIHEILPNNKMLFNIGTKLSPNCDICVAEETNIHMFLYCCKVQECVEVLYRMIFYFCNMNIRDVILKILLFDFPKVDRRIQNTLCIIISSYICCIWSNRENPCYLSNKFKSKVIKEQKYHKLRLKENIKDIFTDSYCDINTCILNHL